MRKFETVNINDATPAQLRDFASGFLGIPVADDDDSAVLAKVRAANDGDTIYVRSGEPEIDQTGSPPPKVEKDNSGGIVGSLGRDDPKVTVTLHAEEKDGVVLNRHKEVGVNGAFWLLKRGEPISIPYRVYEALNNAEKHVITMTPDGERREQVVKNVPFNVVKMPQPDEIDAWHRKTDNVFVP
jgi:hypothetical protein